MPRADTQAVEESWPLSSKDDDSAVLVGGAERSLLGVPFLSRAVQKTYQPTSIGDHRGFSL